MISTHVLDTSKGCPAQGISVALYKQNGKEWSELGKSSTNNDGRTSFDTSLDGKVFKLVFDVEEYLKKAGQPFYSAIPVIFKGEGKKLHIPLLLSPYGYSTYRGS